MADWKELTQITGGKAIEVERVRVLDSGIRIEGAFELPPIAQLPLEDLVFIGEFVKCHGSIKEMERLFGVSYPTIKGRLNKISGKLGHEMRVESDPAPSHADVLDRLERGEITAEEAAKELKK